MDSQFTSAANKSSVLNPNEIGDSRRKLMTQNISGTIRNCYSDNVYSYVSNDDLHVNADLSMRFSCADEGNTHMHASYNLNDDSHDNGDSLTDSFVNVVSFAGAENDTNDQSLEEGEISFTPSDIFTSINQSSSAQLSHATNSSATETHDQSISENLLDLGFKCKGFRMGHINVQGVNNKIDQLRLLC